MTRRKARTAREFGTIAFLCLVILWLCLLVVSIFHKEQTARITVNETRAELAALDARKQVLSSTVQNLDSERGQEASLRATFGVAKPGEDVIIVVPKKQTVSPPTMTFWDKVKQFLGI
jgi:cell division protein FtsB